MVSFEWVREMIYNSPTFSIYLRFMSNWRGGKQTTNLYSPALSSLRNERHSYLNFRTNDRMKRFCVNLNLRFQCYMLICCFTINVGAGTLEYCFQWPRCFLLFFFLCLILKRIISRPIYLLCRHKKKPQLSKKMSLTRGKKFIRV